MIENIPLALLNGLGLMGGIVFIFYMVSTGKSGTPREMREKNEEIRWLRQRNEEQATQLQLLLGERANVVELMTSIRRTAEQRGGAE
jgi:hypothetical protein